jgi:hypothetical protein
MAQQNSNTPEKNTQKKREDMTTAELLATGDYEYDGGGMLHRKKRTGDGRV